MGTMNIEEFNRRFIDKYLTIPKELRSNSSYPFLISFEKSSELRIVPIYFKQPQHWLSLYYGIELTSEELYDKLMIEYNENLMSNNVFKPIELFQEYKNRILKEKHSINIVYNNIIKFSRNSSPDTYDGDLTDQFNDLFEEEYQIIHPYRSVFCIGPEEDYIGLMSWKILNNIEIKPLMPNQPFRVYKDKFGSEVLHTYHPGYWFKIDQDLENIVYRFIIGGSLNILGD